MILDVGAYRFHYQSLGTVGQPAILFLHGFLGSSEDWLEVMENICQDFHCLAIDLPGHGKTQVSGDDEFFQMEKTAKGISDFLNQLGITKSNLVGYSMGGRLGLYLSLTYPNLFKKSLIESSSPGLKTAEERAARRLRDEKLALDMVQTDFSLFLTKWYELPLFETLKQHPKFSEVFNRRKKNQSAALAKSLRQMGTGVQQSLWESLAQAETTFCFLAGEHDEKFIHIGRRMAKICPKASFHIVPNAGHTTHIENTEAFLNEMTSFFTEN
ncbi:alpha/beta hydrolase fold [Chloroherpeton thalassium ATCC 35110]|uniref:Putative 2-succinyl-6-hydroxy-2,4-cyclohexadiene-1-carboxylate synthase n=1 Tax=Chloroherpeton thalassium (strain ATCC 35110 / GB-78) TaxID=517418 RepID=B3QUU1_CHLT3|nr:2-succinyl-6-hydroxy-2,4-cyclohexadiene-1-carboxylate synthase [Chloroherpeton thalassium]ACF14442.1 alpha/beta hydrolase fold [Chloroherpeton thalassium ATCC 35110]